MSIFKCPGSGPIRDPYPEEINCPSCGQAVEIWSDEAEVRCAACGGIVSREIAPSCLEWCAHGRECVGPEKYDRLRAGRKPVKKKGVEVR